MGKGDFQQALVEETLFGEIGGTVSRRVFEELISEAKDRLAELGLRVEDLRVYAEHAAGTVRVEWRVERSHFFETFKLEVRVPMAKRREQLERYPFIRKRLRVIAAAFQRFSYEARIAVFSEGSIYLCPPPEAYLEIPIARRGELEAFLSCRL